MVRCRSCESGAFVAGSRFPRGITSFAPGYAATAITRTVVTPMPRRNAWQRTKRGLQPGGARNEAGGLPDEICAWCGGGYESRHPMQKYCCYECRRQSVAAFMKAVHRDSQARATKGKTCQQCGKTFDAFKRNQKYCSRRCGGDAWIARHLVPATRKRMAARAGRVCQSCGATFDARRDSQLCCSKRCRERVRHGRTRTLNCVECG